MVIAYLVFGMVFGAGMSALTLVGGGGVLAALLAYSAGGSFAILLPIFVRAIVDTLRERRDWERETLIST